MGILADWQIERDVKITPFEVYDRDKQKGKISYGLSGYGYDARCGYKFKVFDVIAGGTIDPKNFDPNMLREIDLTPNGHDWQVDGFCRRCGFTQFHGPDQVYDQMVCASAKPNYILIPPHSFVLAETLEEFTIPRDVLCIVVGKSTYARCGLIVNVTPGEPEWTGKWTVELSNTTPLPLKVYAGEGIMQVMFLRTDGYREALTDRVRDKWGHENLLQHGLLLEGLKGGTCRVSYADKKGRYQGQVGLTIPFVE